MRKTSYGAVGRLQREIENVFGVRISRSALQSLIRELKGSAASSDVPSKTTTSESSPLALSDPESGGASPAERLADEPPALEIENREMGVNCLAEGSADQTADSAAPEGLSDKTLAPPPANTAHSTPFFPKDPRDANYWCDHAGVLIFAAALAAVAKVSATTQSKTLRVAEMSTVSNLQVISPIQRRIGLAMAIRSRADTTGRSDILKY